MFRNVRQRGFIPILQSFGSSPLEMWDSKVKYGWIRRVTDEQVRALTLELTSTNVSTCYIYCPKNPRTSLAILMPIFVMIVKNMNRYFTLEITVLDDRNVHRRFRLSNFQKVTQIQYFTTSMPLCLKSGWNEIYFDLSDLTRRAYNTNYVETTRVQIHANCRIRVLYFCDKLYEDKDIPQKLKMFLPTTHDARKKKSEDEEKREPEIKAETDFEGESELSEEEAEEMFFGESMQSMAETMVNQEIESETAMAVEERTSFVSGIVTEEEEDLSAEHEFEEKEEESIKETPETDVQHSEAEAVEDNEEDEAENEALEG
ncbi:cilia- and flagella-associated protein 20-like [Phymastichus coffea]|uniref:cilia- and flagella-associated protein 20-like n=1 Tax=Phymastichus coffea TaxID=108790 RepID=UPI00273C20E0|nr:cilia- and flagella-associated protein 20-like [Phymastichus coffea]